MVGLLVLLSVYWLLVNFQGADGSNEIKCSRKDDFHVKVPYVVTVLALSIVGLACMLAWTRR